MAIFEEIALTWYGKEYVIPPDRIMACIAKVEDIITLVELYKYGASGTAPIGKLSMAYATVLRHAGARVTDEEVYAGMFADGDTQAKVVAAIDALLQMMLPPESLKGGGEGKPAPESGRNSPRQRIKRRL